jgi:hypothetical protein
VLTDGVSGWAASASSSADLAFEVGEAKGGPKGPKVSGAGTVAALSGSCPDLAMVVQGVKVKTDATTTFFIDGFEDAADVAGGCGNLRPGTKVKVEAAATPNADGSYQAVSVTILDQPGGKPPVGVSGGGTVAALKGTCPTLTMVVHGYPVMTTSSTTYVGGSCSDLAPGTRVLVDGLLAGNSVVAASVEILAPTTSQ